MAEAELQNESLMEERMTGPGYVAPEDIELLPDDPSAVPLAKIDPSQPHLFQRDVQGAYFDRLRAEDPVHWVSEGEFGPYWSVTTHADIMAVDTNHEVYSSESGITIIDRIGDFVLPNFISMDPPKHDVQRNTVVGVVAPRNLVNLQPIIRERAGKILDELPEGEVFNWVERVSIELTTQMLAVLFDFPFADRAKLTYWSDVATTRPAPGALIETQAQRQAELIKCLEYFTKLWNERINQAPGNDLISMLCHGENTKNMQPLEYLGNLILLIVGGNDTTRNTMTGSVLALNQNPDQFDLLRANQNLIPNMVAETIRWQTPLAHMRRQALVDTTLNGKEIRAGEKVVMWYVSGNRDSAVFEDPNAYRIERKNARQHVSFGYGIHRCMGNRLAEMQLKTVWEEILKRFKTVEVMGDPVRVNSNFVKGYSELPVRVTRH